MKTLQKKILHDRFIAFKQEQYVNDPQLLALVTGITSDDLRSYAQGHSAELETNTVDFEGPGFTSFGVIYRKANIQTSTNGWILMNEAGPITDIAQLDEITVPGAYEIDLPLDFPGATVVLMYTLRPDEQVFTAATALLKESFQYEIENTIIVNGEESIEIPIYGNEPCIHGEIPLLEIGSGFSSDYIVEYMDLGQLEIPGLP